MRIASPVDVCVAVEGSDVFVVWSDDRYGAFDVYFKRGWKRLKPITVPKLMANAPASHPPAGNTGQRVKAG